MDSCLGKLSSDLIRDCDHLDQQGMEVDTVLLNRGDIDFEQTTIDRTTNIITNLVLKPGKTGYKIQGVKQINRYLSEIVVNEDATNKWRHSFIGRVYNLIASVRMEVENISQGGSIVAVVERKWKGADNKSPFIVLGLNSGMEISEGSENSAENDGAFVFTLASLDVALEPKMPMILLEGDSYAATKTAFDNKFASNNG